MTKIRFKYRVGLNDAMQEIFRKLGLTGNETKVYLALLELGSVSAGEIIKKSGLSRGQVYDCLDSLMEKGVVSYSVQANRKYFEAVSPKQFRSIIDRKKEELEAVEKELEEAIPGIESKRKLGKAEQEVTLFKGKRGIKSIFDDILEYKKDILAIGGYTEDAETLKYFMRYILPGFHKRRIELKIKMKYVFPEGSLLRAKQLGEMPLTEVRILPAKFGSAMATQIRGDKVDIIVWSSSPVGITMRSKEIAEYNRKYFEFLWNISAPLKQ
jgi:sugar-specific transcriptional regulator TrmB